MAAEFGQSEDVWQSGISCGGGWFVNSICCGRGYFANVTYAGVNPGGGSRTEKQVAELTADLQKMSAQLELSESAPQTVLNNR